ncbi:hypothetical protein HDV06_005427 [Boothiomyces sp. JEL0866]|nr:hypothetical protein HDV06_005427 [Boothiomyces sp. JEL0866]
MGRKKVVVPPPDSDVWQNTTEFRILERKVKRKGQFDESLLVNLADKHFHEILLFNRTLKAIAFDEFPGLYYIPDAIPLEMQKSIVKESLEEWVRPPNVCNLDSHFHLNPNGIWNEYAEWKHSENAEPTVKKRNFEQVQTDRYAPPSRKTEAQVEENCETCKLTAELKKKPLVSILDKETNVIIDAPVTKMSTTNDQNITQVLPRLRWCTLGHQYNWSVKEYHFDRVPPFPQSIVEISNEIVHSLEGLTGYPASKWKPEAGIINFYQPGDTLTAHQDKSEINTEAPLLSFSFGLECVFLFGTEDKSEKPIALKLKSGDMVIMSGPGRRAFHGVPLVIKDTLPENLKANGDKEWELFEDYLSHTRVNLNLRQVY